MSIYATLVRYVARRRADHIAMRISDLPGDLRKDIGWPDRAFPDVESRVRVRSATERPQ